jgi:hypothetical protein
MLERQVDEEISRWVGSYPKGWVTIVEKCIKLVAKQNSLIRIDQIKEKFGGLRFYYTVIDTQQEEDSLFDTPLQDRISCLEYVCSHICEECGTTLDVTTGLLDPSKKYGWLHTYCDRCRKFLLAEKS